MDQATPPVSPPSPAQGLSLDSTSPSYSHSLSDCHPLSQDPAQHQVPASGVADGKVSPRSVADWR